MHPTLFTLGYEGLTIEAFIARLQAAQVKTVVDVRELPLSRKKGFSKSASAPPCQPMAWPSCTPPPWVAPSPSATNTRPMATGKPTPVNF